MLLVCLLSCALLQTQVSCKQNRSESSNGSEESDSGPDIEPQSSSNVETTIDNGLNFLISQQAEDGGWHSLAYGNLRSGAAITALVLYTLSHLPEQEVESYRGNIDRAVEFLRPGWEAKGHVCNPDGSPDYTTYGTAMLLIADSRISLGLTPSERGVLIDYLLAAQIGERQEYEPSDTDYGGWDLAGWMIGPRRTMGTNISVTRIAVEALSYERESRPDVDEALTRTEQWLIGCQNLESDGGFIFHPQRDHHGNKAMWKDESRSDTNSYGTATADGLRILELLGKDGSDASFAKAASWIENHDRADQVPGFEDLETPTGWEQGLWFYYHFVRASLEKVELDKSVNDAIVAKLMDEQNPDGSWENDNGRMREDDPMIATPFAIVTLLRLTEKP